MTFYLKAKAFTLIEILVVIIIIGILAAVALPNYEKAKERALGKEAIANLKLIAAAERIYRMETSGYYPSPGGTVDEAGIITGGTVDAVGTINSNLKLSLTETNWDYSITTIGDPASTFTAYADRVAGSYSSCQYSIDQTQSEPVISSGAGTCP